MSPFRYEHMKFLVGSVLLIFLGFTQTLQAQNYPPERQIGGSPNLIQPLIIGMVVPTVGLNDPNGKILDLGVELLGKPTVLYYYRGGWDPYAGTFLKQLNDMKKELGDLGFQIVAVSLDRPSKTKETIQKYGLSYTVASDSEALFAKALGLAYRVSPYVFADYKVKKFWDIEEASGQKHHILPVPAVYVLDSRGVLRFPYVNPNYKKSLDKETLLTMVKFVKDEEEQRRKTSGSANDDKDNK